MTMTTMSDYRLEQLYNMIVAYPNLLHKLTLGAYEALMTYIWDSMMAPL